MIKYIFIAILLTGISNPSHAGIDKTFGENPSWWRGHYNNLLSSLGIEKSYALVIGVSKYKDNSFHPLPSEKDAIRMKDYLINEAGFDHVRLITGSEVTLEKVSYLMFDHYPGFLTSKDRFLFYWSGHGVSVGNLRKQGFLAVQNSQEKHVSTMISMHDLSHWDRRFKARQTLYLLDACFTGIAAATTMSPNRDQTIERVSRPSSQVLVAGLPNEQTIALEDINGGVFTRALLDGLRGHADTDKGVFKKDGVVTAHELVEYVRERVDHERRRVGWASPITPRLASLPRRHQQGDFFFIADKRVLRQPQALVTENQTKITSTGVVVQHHQQITNNFQEKITIRQGKNGRFYDNGDGTITDRKYKLLWKKCSEGQAGDNCDGVPKKYTWHDANKIFSNSYGNWRMPTIEEFSSLLHCVKGNPKKSATDPYALECPEPEIEHPGLEKAPLHGLLFTNTKPGYYWSKTDNGLQNQAWTIQFRMLFSQNTSYTHLGGKKANAYIRLVKDIN